MFWIFRTSTTVLGCSGFHGDCLTLTKHITARLQVSQYLSYALYYVTSYCQNHGHMCLVAYWVWWFTPDVLVPWDQDHHSRDWKYQQLLKHRTHSTKNTTYSFPLFICLQIVIWPNHPSKVRKIVLTWYKG